MLDFRTIWQEEHFRQLGSDKLKAACCAGKNISVRSTVDAPSTSLIRNSNLMCICENRVCQRKSCVC